MSFLSKDKVIKQIVKKKIYDVSMDFAKEATEDIHIKKFYKYSMGHYKLIYTILKSKLDTMPEKIDKIAYLDCLYANYKLLTNTKCFDIVLGFLTGGIVGAINDIITKITFFIVGIVFAMIKAYAVTTNWDFYIKIFSQLREEIL